jgi:hypothetical protein
MPKPTAPTDTWTLEEARRSWIVAQRLTEGGPLRQIPGGWSRAFGGVDPYLALHAREPAATGADLDAALANGDVVVVPGVRGCVWLVPRWPPLSPSWSRSVLLVRCPFRARSPVVGKV